MQTLSSLEVAGMVGKQHKNLLADVRGYVEELNELKIQPVDFFREATYKDAKGQKRPCYNITKKGCEFIAHKLTGIKGTEFTARYINRFHEMEQVLKTEQPKNLYQPGHPLLAKPWMQGMERKFKYTCETLGYTRRELYHRILLRVGKIYNIDKYKVVYEYQVGHEPAYIMDVVAHFPELRREAEKALEQLEKDETERFLASLGW